MTTREYISSFFFYPIRGYKPVMVMIPRRNSKSSLLFEKIASIMDGTIPLH